MIVRKGVKCSCLLLFLSLASCDLMYNPRNLNKFYSDVELRHVRLRDGNGNIVWEIRRVTGNTDIYEVHFGEVPPGFVQVFPSAGRPRPLRDGERVLQLEVTKTTIMCSHGRASGADGFRQDVYETIPTTGTNAAWREAATRIENCTPERTP